MSDWDNIRFFLTVARKGTVTAAATELGVNHSTVSRRIAAYEKQLGVRLFERLPSGYAVTPAGADMVPLAERMEAEAAALDRRVLGRDTRLSGILRVTAPKSLTVELLMPHIAAFARAYPGIELQTVVSDDFASLSRREADVALRVTKRPPDTLVGRRFFSLNNAVYASTGYLERRGCTATTIQDSPHHSWLWWDGDNTVPKWIRDHYPNARLACRVDAQLVILAAAKAGLGIAQLPCEIADQEPELHRIPPLEPTPSGRDLWLLTHPDLRNTARVRAFMDFMAQALAGQRKIFAGQVPKAVSLTKEIA